MSDFKPSKYQQAIFYFVEHGFGNAVIQAVAGSGKTKTLIEILKLIPKDQRVLFVAFNESIVGELKEKVNQENVDIKTLHSLGLSILKSHFKDKKLIVNEYKYKNYIESNYKTLIGNDNIDTHILNNIIKLSDLSRFYLAQTYKEIEEIALDFDIKIIDNEINIVLKVLDWSYNVEDEIDFTDMIYLPNLLNLTVPHYLRYDFIMIDEVQDTNSSQIELFQKCFKRGARFIAVGDPKQQIYKFCGADDKSFNKLQNLPNTVTLPLSICYRCPKIIVNKAKEIVPEIEAKEDAINGKIIYNTLLDDINEGDMVICRNTAPLMDAYNHYLNAGKKAFIKGKDIGLNLIDKIESTNKLALNSLLDKDGVFVRLYEDVIKKRNKLIKTKNISNEDAILDSRIIDEIELIDALQVLSTGLISSHQLIEKIKEVFSENKDGIVLSTIHKAKGLEADNVYILCPKLLPSPIASKEWEKQQEENLRYVAYTRAKNTLGFIKDTEVKFNFKQDKKEEVLEYFNNIENKVRNIITDIEETPIPKEQKVINNNIKNDNFVKTIENKEVDNNKPKFKILK